MNNLNTYKIRFKDHSKQEIQADNFFQEEGFISFVLDMKVINFFPSCEVLSIDLKNEEQTEEDCDKQDPEKEISNLNKFKLARYFNIAEGGFSVEIKNNKYGPQFVLKSSSYGNSMVSQKFYVSKQVLADLADLFLTASNLEYNSDYVYAAKSSRPVGSGFDSEDESENYDEY